MTREEGGGEKGIPVAGVSEPVHEVVDLEASAGLCVTDPDGHVVELRTWDVAGHLR